MIGGVTKEDHDHKLQQVLGALRRHNLAINDTKSEFCQSSVRFLGFILSSCGLSPDPQRVIALDNISPSKTAKQLKSILGTLQFYSRFTPSFSSLAAPLFPTSQS